MKDQNIIAGLFGLAALNELATIRKSLSSQERHTGTWADHQTIRLLEILTIQGEQTARLNMILIVLTGVMLIAVIIQIIVGLKAVGVV